MSVEPLVLQVEGWSLEVSVRENDAQVVISTDSEPPTQHYVRLTLDQADELQEYLAFNLPRR